LLPWIRSSAGDPFCSRPHERDRDPDGRRNRLDDRTRHPDAAAKIQHLRLKQGGVSMAKTSALTTGPYPHRNPAEGG
jgi:hypothetical protein